jgi:hypothetical protein
MCPASSRQARVPGYNQCTEHFQQLPLDNGCLSNSGTLALSRQNTASAKYNDDISLLIYCSITSSLAWSYTGLSIFSPTKGNLTQICIRSFCMLGTDSRNRYMFATVLSIEPRLNTCSDPPTCGSFLTCTGRIFSLYTGHTG